MSPAAMIEEFAKLTKDEREQMRELADAFENVARLERRAGDMLMKRFGEDSPMIGDLDHPNGVANMSWRIRELLAASKRYASGKRAR